MSESAAPTVLVTRPEPGAAQSEKRLRRAGYDPVVISLTEIAASEPAVTPEAAATFDAAVVTSANGIRFAPDPLKQALRGKPLYTVGSATAAIAREDGFESVTSADGAVDNLVSLVAGRVQQGARLTYLAGQRRTGDLEGKLGRAGFDVTVAEVYRTREVSQLTDKLDSVFSVSSPAATLFHSALSSRLFSRYAAEHDFEQALENTLFLALSERVAAPLPAAWNERILVARRPTEDALMAMLESRIPPSRA